VLASLLIALDVTPLRLAQIARASFVKAGAVAARKRSSGRPHLARIAALTGLSRNEVKRIVSANYTVGELEPEHSPRALRVLSAWRQSTTRKPKRRQNALRIPFRVILAELLQRKSVHLVRKGTSVGISKSGTARPGRQRDLNTLLYAASFLAELADPDRVLVRRKERVVVPASFSAAYVEQATAGKVSAFLDHLPMTFANSLRAERKRGSVNVFALVSRPKRSR